MEAAIDLSKKKNITQQLEEILTELLQDKRNKETSKTFFTITKNIKPKNCIVKTGWVSGKYISFDCKCMKNGKNDLIKAINKGMEKKADDLFFIYGLNPEIFHFNPDFVVEEPNFFFFRFKLQCEK